MPPLPLWLLWAQPSPPSKLAKGGLLLLLQAMLWRRCCCC